MKFNQKNKISILRNLLFLSLTLWHLGAAEHNQLNQITIDAPTRTILKYALTGAGWRQQIPGPPVYINCDSSIKRRLKGRIIFNNGSPARFFPIMDRTTLKVWPTDKLGQFDFDYPGGCAISIGSYGQRSHGRAFKFINERAPKMEADLHVMDDVYVVMISESVPNKQTETALMARYEHGPSWPYPEPMSCVEGKVPEKAIDFYPFLIHREKQTYFSGIEVQGKFSVRFYRNQPFSFIAYSNKPRGKIIIYTTVEKNLRSGHEDESTGPCRAIEIKETRELTYAELSTPSIMDQLRSGL